LLLLALTFLEVQAAEVIWDGHYRASALGQNSLSLSADHELSDGLALGMEHQLQLRPIWAITANVALHAQMDLLSNAAWGGAADTWTDPVTGEAIVLADANGVAPAVDDDVTSSLLNNMAVRRVWGDIYTPYGRLRIGRMPLEWGSGILFNAGTDPDDRYGDSVDRVQFTGRFGAIYVVGAWDLLHEGLPNAQDDMQAANLVVAYRTENIAVGLLNRVQFQPDPNYRSYTGDLWGKAQLGPMQVEGEVAMVLGSGDLGNGADDVSVSAFGTMLSFQGDVGDVTLGAELGWASGDEDPDDGELHTFTFDRDHDVGLLLFEQPMPTFEAAVANTTNNGRDLSGVLTGNAVRNAQYMKPSLGYTPLEGVDTTASVLLARAAKTTDGAGRGYGAEYGLDVKWTLYENFWLQGTGALLMPGPQFKSHAPEDLGTDFTDPAYAGRLLATVEF